MTCLLSSGERPRYSASIGEAVTHDCSLDNQETVPDASMKVYLPWVEREVKGHALQSELEYTSKPARGELCGRNSSLKKLSIPSMYAKTRVTPAQVQERNDGLGVAGVEGWGLHATASCKLGCVGVGVV